MLLDKKVNVKLSGHNIQIYRNIGYNIPYHIDKRGRKSSNGEFLIVDIKDIPLKTHNIIVNVKCDYCNSDFTQTYANYNRGHKEINKDCCSNCTHKKTKEINIIKYGTNKNSELSIIKGFKNGRKKKPYTEIEKLFANKNLELLISEKEYINNNYRTVDKLKYRCNIHKDSIQYISYDGLSQSIKGCRYCAKELVSGENNWNWKGGINSENENARKSLEYKQWRKSVFKRDKYTCQCCGDNTGGNLNAHHIENFSNNEELRYDVDNGITLCKNCHSLNIEGSFHSVYGAYNNTRKQLEEYIKNKMSGKPLVIKRDNGSGTRNKWVVCVTTGKVFKSIKEAYLYYNISHHLSEALKDNKQYYGELSDGTKLEWVYYSNYITSSIADKM